MGPLGIGCVGVSFPNVSGERRAHLPCWAYTTWGNAQYGIDKEEERILTLIAASLSMVVSSKVGGLGVTMDSPPLFAHVRLTRCDKRRQTTYTALYDTPVMHWTLQ